MSCFLADFRKMWVTLIYEHDNKLKFGFCIKQNKNQSLNEILHYNSERYETSSGIKQFLLTSIL